MKSLAPIILFAYNRPLHTEQTLEALMANQLANESILYIYADGPKVNMDEHSLLQINFTRQILRKKQWCKEVHFIERAHNLGLAENVIDGVTKVVNKHGKIIVLEDDLITSPYFLTYCNDGLEMYQDNQNVYSINAYQFPIDFKIDKADTFLCPLATSSWGWATWKEKWEIFEKEPKNKMLIQNETLLRQRFNFADYDYANMLDNQKSWAIRWYHAVFLRNGLGLFPTHSLVQNNGFDGSGENCGIEELKQEQFPLKINLKKKEAIDLHAYALLMNHFLKPNLTTAKSRKTLYQRLNPFKS
jgi:hypothetical protein